MTIRIHHSKAKLFAMAEHGNSDAMYSIGYRYLEGVGGLPKNQAKANEWFIKAMQGGSKKARVMLDKLSISNKPIITQATDKFYSDNIITHNSDFGAVIAVLIIILLLYKLPTLRKKLSLFFCAALLTVVINFLWLSAVGVLKTELYKLVIIVTITVIFCCWVVVKLSKNSHASGINKKFSYIYFYLDKEINKHILTLSLKNKQTIIYDDYGNHDNKKWMLEINYFIDNVLKKDETLKNLLEHQKKLNIDAKLLEQFKNELGDSTYKKWCQLPTYSDIQNIIAHKVDRYNTSEKRNKKCDHIDVDSLSPLEFEHYCAGILKANGWRARVTQTSGDQGIDIIAEYKGKKAVFQCKKYASPVGNKAVQEVIAGKQFTGASIAAVVSNATYTSSAKQLANTTGVYLLHHSELPQFKRLVLTEKKC